MPIINKSILDVMTESAKIDSQEVDTLFTDEIEKELDSEIDDIAELEESFKYTPNMIPVFEKDGKFYVEYTDLRKLVECGDCECDEDECDDDSEIDALGDIIDANEDDGMTLENTFVMIESNDYMKSVISEIKATIKSGTGVDKKTGKAKLVKAADVFKNLKNKGIKVVKKKSKKKK